MTSDLEQERQWLAHLYSGMTPWELQKIAADGASLTDTAREALRTEITRKGLSLTVNETPAGVDVLEERDLLEIGGS